MEHAWCVTKNYRHVPFFCSPNW